MAHILDLVSQRFWLTGGTFFLVVTALGLVIERVWPAGSAVKRNDLVFGAFYALATRVTSTLVTPFYGLLGGYVISLHAQGLVDLDRPGWAWLLFGFAVFFLSSEVLEYWWHRALHAYTWLWAIHSFHHSEESINILTTWRDFWLAGAALKTLLIYAPLSVIFHVGPAVYLMVLFVHGAAGVLMHLNARIELGAGSLLFMNPQFHRIHHSVEREHWNKNFAITLPVCDFVFGTAWLPRKGEFPETGLVPAGRPEGLLDALVWPLRYPAMMESGVAGSPLPTDGPRG